MASSIAFEFSIWRTQALAFEIGLRKELMQATAPTAFLSGIQGGIRISSRSKNPQRGMLPLNSFIFIPWQSMVSTISHNSNTLASVSSNKSDFLRCELFINNLEQSLNLRIKFSQSLLLAMMKLEMLG